MKRTLFVIWLLLLSFYIIISISIAKDVISSIDPKTEIKVVENNFDYYEVTVTAYSPSKSETDSTPGLTAIHEKPIPGGTVAVSRDLLKYLGNKVYVYQVGVFRVNDLMNKRYKNRIDICMGKEEAKQFGIKKNIKVVFIDG